jgi:predicted secreted protein
MIIAVVILMTTLLPACSGTTSTVTQKPIDVVSVWGPLSPVNPGGPVIEITLKNVSTEPVIALKAGLGINRAGSPDTPFTFNFDVSSSNPLPADATISSQSTLIGGGFSENVDYSLLLEGALKNGIKFSYTVQVQIESPPVQTTDPWPGVSTYNDSNSPIVTSVNNTFAIVLPPAPLFGWSWQNSDSSAFSLLESKTIPESSSVTETYGPDAFLFKAIETGSFQIILYVPSKPPQQLEIFNVEVNP